MVRGWKGNTWSFPKGKIDANETELQCALRECREEVGYDVDESGVGDGDWIEAAVNGKSVKLFMVAGVDETYNFETRTRKEISGIEWVDIGTLPSYSESRRVGSSGGGEDDSKERRKFWNVMPFVDELRRWIANKRRGGKPNQRRNNKQQQQPQPKGIKPPPSQPIAIQSNDSLSVASSPHPTLSSSVPSASSHPSTHYARPSTPGGRPKIDDSNALTFAGGGVGGGRGGGGGGGWSAEEMFALNEAKYGVRSSVVEEKLEEPHNIDEIMRSVLGPKYRGGGGGGARGSSRGDRGGGKHRSVRSEQLPNPNHQSGLPSSNSPTALPPLPEQSLGTSTAQSQQRGRGFRGRGRGNNRNTVPLPDTGTAANSAPLLNVEELDFSHNPYQSRTLAVSTTASNAATVPSRSSATQPSPSSVLPSPASFSQLSAKSAATPTTQPQATNGSSAVPPPFSARASERSAGGKAGQSTFSEFRFDLDSILQPLSATKLD